MNIKELVSQKAELIKLKKAATKFTDGWGTPSVDSVVNKGVVTKMSDGDVISKTIVGNTYYWMDSHEDVHVKGCFKKSIKETKKIFHLHDHEFKISSQVGDISKAYEKDLSWSTFGVSKQGNTTALLADSDIKKVYNGLIFEHYNTNKIDQHSVGMQYVSLDLAVNDEDYEDEYKHWLEIFPMLGNPEAATEKGYFWIVRECKLVEISAVLMGSNSLTPTLESKQEPSDDTLAIKDAAAKALRTKEFFINLNS
jgi:hypothetical protein